MTQIPISEGSEPIEALGEIFFYLIYFL